MHHLAFVWLQVRKYGWRFHLVERDVKARPGARARAQAALRTTFKTYRAAVQHPARQQNRPSPAASLPAGAGTSTAGAPT